MVTGVAGGMIDVNGLVSQLMQIERQPLVRLERRETQIQSRLSALGRITGALSSLDGALNTLGRAATFAAGKATVSGEGLAAAASGTPSPGRYAVAVTQLARVQSSASARVATATTDIGSGTVTLRNADGSAVLGTFTVGGGTPGTLSALRDQINAADVGVRASLIGDAGQVRLVLNSEETGAANGFVVDTDPGLAALAFDTKQTAQDAQFSVNGLALTSPGNTVRDAIEGVVLTLTQAPPAGSPPGTTITGEVAVATDSESIATAVKDFVRSYNDAEKLIGELTQFDPNTNTAAILNGESVLRRVQGDLRVLLRGTQVTSTPGALTRLADIGITFQADGQLKLDEKKLNDMAAAEPAKLSQLFAATSTVEAEQGFAVRLRAKVKSFTEPAGTLEARQAGLRASIKLLDQQQERMQARLALIQERLIRQYSRLDALMSTSQSQSNALANALAGLPSIK